MRGIVLVLAIAMLCGCTNQVRSTDPWFTKADAADAPSLRPGVWATDNPDPKCKVDEKAPLEAWPDCAHDQSFVVRADDILRLQVLTNGEEGHTTTTYAWAAHAFILASGDPRIRQQTDCLHSTHKKASEAAASDAEAAASDAAMASAMASDTATTPAVDASAQSADQSAAESATLAPEAGPVPSAYCYTAIRPTQLGSDGKIIAYVAWPVLCGPWPKPKKDGSGGNVTDAPFPGIHVIDEDCSADSVAALRGAAKASEAYAMRVGPPIYIHAHRVRDGYR
jgi:hypothetical protein